MPVIDVIEPGARALVQRHHHRPRRRDRNGRHDLVRRVRRSDRPHRGAGPLVQRRLPRVRRVRRAWPDRRRRGDGARRAPAGADLRCRRRRPAARMHALSVPRPHDQRRDGAGRHARQLGRRDRLRRPRPAGGARAAARPVSVGRAVIGSCRAATSSRSASSAAGCSVPSSTTPSAGRSKRRRCRAPHSFHDRRSHDPTRRPRRRRTAPDQLRTRLHRDGCRLVPGDVRPHACAVHGFDRRGRAALDARQRQGLGHRRVLDAARIVGRANRPGSGARQAERAHGRDPAPDRSRAARRVRHDDARRTTGDRRLRRVAGRRRDPHGEHLRRLPGTP